MPILNYTTSVESNKTIAEIQDILARAGASAILTEYDNDRNISAVSFKILLDDKYISFRLPSDPRPVLAALVQQKKDMQRAGKRFRVAVDENQARRVTWRILKDWIEAQMALIEAHQATLAQVFLPYAITNDGRTMYEYIAGNSELLLSKGGDL